MSHAPLPHTSSKPFHTLHYDSCTSVTENFKTTMPHIRHPAIILHSVYIQFLNLPHTTQYVTENTCNSHLTKVSASSVQVFALLAVLLQKAMQMCP